MKRRDAAEAIFCLHAIYLFINAAIENSLDGGPSKMFINETEILIKVRVKPFNIFK